MNLNLFLPRTAKFDTSINPFCSVLLTLGDSTKALSNTCHKPFDVSNMGTQAVKSYAKSKTHINQSKVSTTQSSVTSFFGKSATFCGQ